MTSSALPQTFNSDGCTLWPDVWFGRSITHCCNNHDVSYAIGIPPKWQADVALAACAFETTGSGGLAGLMLAGVLLFGGFFRRRAARK